MLPTFFFNACICINDKVVWVVNVVWLLFALEMVILGSFWLWILLVVRVVWLLFALEMTILGSCRLWTGLAHSNFDVLTQLNLIQVCSCLRAIK